MDNQPAAFGGPQPGQVTPPLLAFNPQPTAPSPAKSSRNLKKPIIIAVAAIVILCGVAYGTYKWEHNRAAKAEANLNSQLTSLNKQVAALQKANNSSNTSAKTTAPNPYAGWKSYTLKYEKLTFNYPSTWTVQDSSASQGLTPNADSVTLTGSDGYQVSINDGWDGGGDSLGLVTDSPVPVKFLGNTDYLVFSHPKITGPAATGPDQRSSNYGSALLMTNPSDQYGQNNTANYFPQDKNAHGDPSINNGGSTMLITGGYSGTNAKTFTTVSLAQADPEFKNFVLVIQSMHY